MTPELPVYILTTSGNMMCLWSTNFAPYQPSSESESGYISSSHIRLIRCLAVIGQASFTREHLV